MNMDENEHQAFEDGVMSLETDILPVLCEVTVNGSGTMQRVEGETISQFSVYQLAPSPPEAFSAVIATPKGVSFPHETETTVVEELEQKRDDYIPIKTTADDLPTTGKIESTGVVRSELCGEQRSTIRTCNKSGKGAFSNTGLTHTNTFLSYPQVPLFSLLIEIQVD